MLPQPIPSLIHSDRINYSSEQFLVSLLCFERNSPSPDLILCIPVLNAQACVCILLVLEVRTCCTGRIPRIGEQRSGGLNIGKSGIFAHA